MELQSLIDQWECMGEMDKDEWHPATQPGRDEENGWTAEWVLRILFAPHRVQASYQEEEALRHFEQTQREGTR